MIRIMGDTHGDQSRFLYNTEEKTWTEDDIIIVTGDFGFIFWNDYSEQCFLDDLETKPYTLAFVEGNHEGNDAINQYPVEIWNGGKIHRIRKNIIHLMRGQVFTIQGKIFFTMGGAYSPDRYMRFEGKTWFPEELPDDVEYREAYFNLAANNFRVDYILTHTCPRSVIAQMGRRSCPHERRLNGFLDWVKHQVAFSHWYFGHWHQDRRINDQFTVMYKKTIALK